MFPLQHRGNLKLSIFKDAKGEKEKRDNIKNKTLEHKNILFVSLPGKGKSTAICTLMDELKENAKCVVIQISTKDGSEFDNAYCVYEAKRQYHLDLLEKQKRKPQKREVKFYAPFTFGIGENNPKNLKKKMPPINFFTFSIKKQITEEGWSTLLYGDADKYTVRTCVSIAKNLNDDETFWDLNYKVEQKIAEKDDERVFSDDIEDLGSVVGTTIDKKTATKIRTSLSILLDEFFIQPNNCTLNIDFGKILNDPKHFHFFIARWIKDNRMRYFFYVNLISALNEYIKQHPLKYDLVILFEEIKVLLPATSKGEVSFQANLADLMAKLLSEMRSKGITVIGSTQVLTETNSKVNSVFNERFYGVMSDKDTARIFKEQALKTEQLNFLKSLKTGEFVRWDELKQVT